MTAKDDMNANNKRIILASASPRRREILQSNGLEFEIRPADIDESAVRAPSPRMLVKRLSAAKARAEQQPDAVVIGADTVVALRGKVYGKPCSCKDAEKMLSRLCGRWHSVYTGVTVICDGHEVCFSEKSKVKLKKLSVDEIRKYVDDVDPLDKAGAYGIQDGLIVEKYRGSYTNIVGLPVEKLAKVLAGFGVRNVNG